MGFLCLIVRLKLYVQRFPHVLFRKLLLLRCSNGKQTFISWDLKQSLVWKEQFPPLLFSILSFSLALVCCRWVCIVWRVWRLAGPLKPVCLWQKIHHSFTHNIVMGCLVLTDLTWILKKITGVGCRKFSFNVFDLHSPILAITNKYLNMKFLCFLFPQPKYDWDQIIQVHNCYCFLWSNVILLFWGFCQQRLKTLFVHFQIPNIFQN